MSSKTFLRAGAIRGRSPTAGCARPARASATRVSLRAGSWLASASAASAGYISMNVVHDARIECLAAFLPQQADRRVEAHRLVVRPLGHQRVEVVDDGQDARAERNLLALEPAG